MLEKQSVFTGCQIHQHSEYLSDYFVLSSLCLRVVFSLPQRFWHSLLGSFTSSFVLVGQVQKRMPLSVIIVVCYFVFLEDGWLNSSRLKTFSSGTFLGMELKM